MKKMFLAEMAYPSGFSFDELNKLTSFAARQRYCRQHLKRIGSGSSRVVFLVDDEKVLKLAKNPKGIAQNEREAGFHDGDIGLFAKTFEVADDSTWIEMEAAKKVTQREFKRVCGITYKLFCLLWGQIAIDFGVTGLNRWYWESTEAQNFCKQFLNDEWMTFSQQEYKPETGLTKSGWELFDDIVQWHYYYSPDESEIGDGQRLANMGIVTRDGQERVVMVDFGIDMGIYNKHYKWC